MLRLILRLVLLLLAVRVIFTIFNAGAQRRRVRAPETPKPVADDDKASARLGGTNVDADFEDLPGEERKS